MFFLKWLIKILKEILPCSVLNHRKSIKKELFCLLFFE